MAQDNVLKCRIPYGILTQHCVRSFILQRNSIYYMAYLPMSVDLPTFKIDKIQDQSVCE